MDGYIDDGERERERARARAINTYIYVQWIDGRRSRGRALVGVAKEQGAAIVAVRGSVNVHNFVSACKIWPHRRADVPVAVHAGYAEVTRLE